MACQVRYLSSAGIQKREVKGLDALAKAFPASWLVYASLNAFPRSGPPIEIDVLVVMDDRIVLLELKDWNGPLASRGDLWVHGRRTQRSPVQLGAEKARKIKTIVVGQIPSLRGVYVDSRVVLTATSTRNGIAEAERPYVLTLEEAKSLAGREERNRLLGKVTLNRVQPNMLVKDFEKLFGGGAHFQPLKRSWDGYGVTDEDFYVHAGDVWREHRAELRREERVKALLRLFRFDKLPVGLNEPGGRGLIADRELKTAAFLGEQGSWMAEGGILKQVGTPPDEILTEHHQLVSIPSGWTTLRRYLERHGAELAGEHRVDIMHKLASMVAELHARGVAYRDIGADAVWLGSPTSMSLTGFFSATLPDETSVADFLAVLGTYAEADDGTGANPTGRERDVRSLGALMRDLSAEAEEGSFPPGWAAVMARALASPGERYPDARALADALGQLRTPSGPTVDQSRLDAFQTAEIPYVAFPPAGPLSNGSHSTRYESVAAGRRAIVKVADAMRMLKAQVAVTPPPQWVRVVGGFTAHQFAERRLPTIDELNAAAPETPVFVLHLYDRALLNAAALRVVGYTRDTPDPPGGEIVRDAGGAPTGLLLAAPNANLLYATLANGPKLPFDHQVNSTRHFMRELNRLGVTGVIDAGGGFQNYPEDYAVVEKLAADDQLTLRIGYNLFTQKPKREREDFLNWTATTRYQQGTDYFRHNGAGEMLVFSAADFEDFRQPRPDLPPEMEGDLEGVVRILAQNRWPWRLHATYDETIARALDVFEKVDGEIPLGGLNWFFDHAETISERSIDRIAALGGGVAVQHRMAYQGEYFVERYGSAAAEATPPVRRMLGSGIAVSAGSDATRVSSYNPWVGLAWLITGRTVGGLRVTPRRNCLDRETALRMWTEKVTWFSNEEGRKGRIEAGQFADLIVTDRDLFGCAEDEIAGTTSLLTIVGGRVVWGAGGFAPLAPPAPPAMPDWSPVNRFGGYGAWGEGDRIAEAAVSARLAAACGCSSACGVHGHDHAASWTGRLPVADLKGFWGALGCACWAV